MAVEGIYVFDALMSLLGIVGIWPAIHLMFSSSSPNPAERKLKLVLIFMGLSFLSRANYVLTQSPILGAVVYSLFILTGLHVFLFFETLLRRHFPLALKIWLALTIGVFLALAISGHLAGNHSALVAFIAALTIAQVWTLILALKRNRDDYSKSENRYIDLILVTLLIMSPFFFTDISDFNPEAVPRLGVLGALFFAFISINAEQLFEQKNSFPMKAFKALSFSLILSVMILELMSPQPFAIQARIFVLFLCVNLIFRIYFAAKHAAGSDVSSQFVQHVQETPKASRDQFLAEIDKVFGNVRKSLLTPKEVPLSDTRLFKEVFEARQTSVFSIYELREVVEDPNVSAGTSEEDLETIEKMIHLLQTNKMNHICLIDADDGLIALFDLIAIGYGKQVRLQAGFLADLSKLIKAISGIPKETFSQLR